MRLIFAVNLKRFTGFLLLNTEKTTSKFTYQQQVLSLPQLCLSYSFCDTVMNKPSHANQFLLPGLCGWNCRHNFYPFYPGVSGCNYTDERLAGLDARDIPYGGGLFAGHSNTGQTTGIMRVIPPRMTNARHPRSASAIGLVLRYCRPVRLLSSSRSTKTKTPAGVRRVLLFWWS